MIRESLLPSEVAAGAAAFSASAFLGAFVFFTAGASTFAEAVAACLVGAMGEQAARRTDAALSRSKAEYGWILLAQGRSIDREVDNENCFEAGAR